jgi:hypothetical protein
MCRRLPVLGAVSLIVIACASWIASYRPSAIWMPYEMQCRTEAQTRNEVAVRDYKGRVFITVVGPRGGIAQRWWSIAGINVRAMELSTVLASIDGADRVICRWYSDADAQAARRAAGVSRGQLVNRRDCLVVSIPHWWVIGLATVVLLASTARTYRAASRGASGRCIRCGYDVRASPEGCPECGYNREVK